MVLGWYFKISEPYTKYAPFNTACTSMHEGALCGRETLTAGTDYIISFPNSTEAPQLTSTNRVMLRTSCGKMGVTCGKEDREVTFTDAIALPFLQASDFD